MEIIQIDFKLNKIGLFTFKERGNIYENFITYTFKFKNKKYKINHCLENFKYSLLLDYLDNDFYDIVEYLREKSTELNYSTPKISILKEKLSILKQSLSFNENLEFLVTISDDILNNTINNNVSYFDENKIKYYIDIIEKIKRK